MLTALTSEKTKKNKSLLLKSSIRGPYLGDNSPRGEFRITISGVLLYGEACEVDADACVVDTAVEHTSVERTGHISLEILAAGRTRPFDVLVAADEVTRSEQVVDGLPVALRAQ